MKLEVDLRIIESPADERKLDKILEALTQLINAFTQLRSEVMGKLDDVIKAVDDATNAVAARIQKLIDQIATGMTPQEVADAKTALQAEVDRLTTLGSDPVNPVPPEPPAP